MHQQSLVPDRPPFGALLSQHRGKFSVGGWGWYIGGLLAVGGAVLLGKSLIALASGGPEASNLGLAAATLAVGLAVLVVPMWRWRQTVTCYDNGILWQRLIGQKTIRRADIADVQLIHHTGRDTNHHEIEIKTANGTFSIIGVHHPEQIVSHVRSWMRGVAVASQHSAHSHRGWAPPVGGMGGTR